jgi:uncharacterized surface protein with fasciclin (FAS1) repeats
MRKFDLTSVITVIVVTLSLPVAALAHCGACGAHDHAAHAEQASVDSQPIYTLAKGAGFNTLTAAVEAAGLAEVLDGDGPFTVFAPTDEAFAKLPEGTVESLLKNPEALKKVLMYHVVAGNVTSDQVVKLESAETLEGQKVAINAEDGVMINNANVIKADIGASNGVVHVIDTVLIPENL